MEHDVAIVIVGAGPAGCATALHLARARPDLAARALVLERARHPRPKLCGGGLVPDAEICLRHLGLTVDDVPHVEVPWVHLLYRGRGPRVRLGAHAFRAVKRADFDAWLANRVREAGVSVREETRVRAVRAVAGGVELDTDAGPLRARAVVGADGARGVVRRAVIGPDTAGVARVVEVNTPAGSPTFPAAPIGEGEAYFDFAALSDGIPGYAWSFPAPAVQGEARRTWGVYDSRVVPAPAAGPLGPPLGQLLRQRGYEPGAFPIEGHPFRWLRPGAPLSTPRLLLVGDAAGADPLFGEGISAALGYGALAAAALARACDAGDFSFRDWTARVQASRLGRALRWRLRLARALYGLPAPALQRLLWWHGGGLVTKAVRRLVFGWAEAN